MPADPKRVKDIFLEAADLPDEAARAAFLDRSCRGDDELRARVAALLRAHDPDGSFLGTPAAVVPDPESAGTMTFDSANPGGRPDDDESDVLAFLTPPRRPDSLGRIGHYEVLEVLGRGGFGIVFRAFDDTLQRVVAVKVLAPQMAATSPARRRFLREARSSAKVRHENVVQVYAVEEEPLPYLVMEFVPGETLQQRLDRTGPLDPVEVVKIGRQLAEGLAAAHATGLIHRDIKPANVLIESGPHRHVKVTDFGLARAADDASLTQSGMVAGTPMYMAPEQAGGDALDHRADLFSLGSVLYALCSGRPPFRANSTLAVLKRVAEDTPRPIPEIIPEVPRWLCDIIAKLHAKKPEDRFGSAQEVADLLGRGLAAMLRHEPAPAFPELAPIAPAEAQPARVAPELAPVPNPRRRNRRAALAAALLVLVGGFALAEATGTTNARGALARLFSPRGAQVADTGGPDTTHTPSVAKVGPEPALTPKPLPEVRPEPVPSKLALWTVPKPLEMKSEGGATLTLQSDGAILVSGVHPDTDVYTLTFRGLPARIEALRLEVLPHDSLPNKGPGRADNGEFVLTTVRAHLDSTNLKLAEEPWADNARGDDSVARFTVDEDDGTGWVTEVGKPHFAVFDLQEPVADAAGKVLRVTLEFKWSGPKRQLGCFRLSVASDTKAAKPFADTDGWERSLPALPADEQVKAVSARLKELNPKFDGTVTPTIENGAVTGLEFPTDQVSDLSPVRGLTKLRALNCSGTDVGRGQVRDLAALRGLPLTELRCLYNSVSDLAPLKGMGLTLLDCRHTNVGDADLKHLAGFTNLRTLSLWGTKVTGAGLKELSGLKQLEWLSLESTQVTDAGLKELAGLKTLTHLSLYNATEVTDAGLEELAHLKALQWLDLRGTKATDAGIKKLAAALPALKIERN